MLVVLGVLLYHIQKSFGSPREAADKLRSLGAIGPIAIVLFIIMEVVVAPIPGYFIAVASGYAFGIVWGTLYSYVGNIIGTAIAFLLSRHVGRPLVERLVNRNKLGRYDTFFKESGRLALWFAFLFPIFPADIMSFVTGLSDMRFREFMFIAIVAYLPNMLMLNYFGSVLYESGLGVKALVSASAFLFCAVFGSFLYRHIKKGTLKSVQE